MIRAVTERLIKKHARKVQPHLAEGERIVDAVAGITVNLGGDPSVRVGGRLASQLQGTEKRMSGVLCITDRRVVFFRTGPRGLGELFGTGLTSSSELAGQVPRDQVAGLNRLDRLNYAVVLSDGSEARFTGNRHDYVAIATALDLTIDPTTGEAHEEDL